MQPDKERSTEKPQTLKNRLIISLAACLVRS